MLERVLPHPGKGSVMIAAKEANQPV